MNSRDYARALGRKGGRARARRLSAAQRKRIAALGGRLRARSFEAARRIAENFQYLNAIRELVGTPKVKRLRVFKARLPEPYA